ncbi:MAG: enoyl-CoA hydratase/isomerase family protein, partial [Proteobacteria bacterium]
MHIKSEIKDSVLIWQLSRPDRRNALGPILAEELWVKVNELAKNLPTWPDPSSAPRLLAIKALSDMGDKDPIWIAGGDLRELSELKNPIDGRNYAKRMAEVCLALQTLPIPVVALIDGLVIGGGIEFALAADLRFATKRSRFHFKQLELGLSTAYASAGRLTHLVGASRAMNWLLRSSTLTARAAWEAGLITELVDSENGLEKELMRLRGDIMPL